MALESVSAALAAGTIALTAPHGPAARDIAPWASPSDCRLLAAAGRLALHWTSTQPPPRPLWTRYYRYRVKCPWRRLGLAPPRRSRRDLPFTFEKPPITPDGQRATVWISFMGPVESDLICDFEQVAGEWRLAHACLDSTNPPPPVPLPPVAPPQP